MSRIIGFCITLAALAAFGGGAAGAATVPFTEDFDADVAGWEDNINEPLVWAPMGGPDDDSHATTAFDYFGFVEPFPGAGPIVFRAHDEDDASGGAFVGDWPADGVQSVSAWFRHDASVSLTFGLRVASTVNFPGAFIESTAGTVPPGVWTEVVFDLDPANPLCSPEGPGPTFTCADALADVAHVQLGTDAPADLTENDLGAVQIDVDRVSLRAVPEPAAMWMLALGGVVLAGAGVRRSR